MSRNISLMSGLLASLMVSTQVAALPYQSLTPRLLAMGGVGVASGDETVAALVNPALIASNREAEGFNLVLPVLGRRFSDPDGLLDKMDSYQAAELETALADAVVAYQDLGASSVKIIDFTDEVLEVKAAAQSIADVSQLMLDQLQEITGRPVMGEFLSAATIRIPNKRLAVSLVMDTRVVAGGVFEFGDEVLLQGIIEDANTTADAIDQDQLDALEQNPAIAGQLFPEEDEEPVNAVENLTSNLSSRGAIISEVGLVLSREFVVAGHDVAVGITPKLVKVKTFDYVLGIDSARFDSDLGQREYTDFNLDVGLAKDFANGWRTGLVVNNLLGKTYDTRPFSNVSGRTPVSAEIKIDPQVRLGVSHSSEWLTLAADLDVTENDSVGFESSTQYFGVGAELQLLDWGQLRAGYRHNLSDSDDGMPTLGIGFSPFGVAVDLAIAGNGDEQAFSFQLGFKF